MEFNWGVFWALLAAFAILFIGLGIYAAWRSKFRARRASREEMIDAAVNAFTAGAFTKRGDGGDDPRGQ